MTLHCVLLYNYNIMIIITTVDPEEFLNMLFKYTLNVEPFISIK